MKPKPTGKVTGIGRTVNDAAVGQSVTEVQLEEVRWEPVHQAKYP